MKYSREWVFAVATATNGNFYLIFCCIFFFCIVASSLISLVHWVIHFALFDFEPEDILQRLWASKAFLTSMRGNSGFILMILAVKYCENMRIVEWSPQSLSVDYKSILQWCIGTNIRMGVEIDKKRQSIPIERWLDEKKTSIALTSYNSKTININARFSSKTIRHIQWIWLNFSSNKTHQLTSCRIILSAFLFHSNEVKVQKSQINSNFRSECPFRTLRLWFITKSCFNVFINAKLNRKERDCSFKTIFSEIGFGREYGQMLSLFNIKRFI